MFIIERLKFFSPLPSSYFMERISTVTIEKRFLVPLISKDRLYLIRSVNKFRQFA